mgnify:CR=1 FL=1
MTLDEAETTFKNAIQQLAESQVEDNLLTALDMLAGVKLRLAEGGGRADGSAFSDYSPIYSKVRATKGLKISDKDFNVTGQLYASMKPDVKSVNFGEVRIDLTVRGSDNEIKVIGQLKRDGNILEPSPAEILDAIEANKKRRFERARNLFG